MFTILGSDGKEYGPVTAGKLHEWIAAGRANLQTKARRADEPEWKTLGDFPEFSQFGTGGTASAPLDSPAPEVPPAIPVSASVATPAVAPVVGATPLSGTSKEIADHLIARAAPLDVFDCLSRSFELWKSDFLPLVGVTLLVLLVQMVVGFIPVLGMVSGLFLKGVFYGGLFYYYLGKMRGEPREVGDAFAGFSKAFVPLMVATLLTSVIILLVTAVCFFPWLAFAFNAILHRTVELPPFTPAMFAGLCVGLLALTYLSVSWAFVFALVIDRSLSPWTAMEVSRRVVSRQWFRVFFVMLLGGILAMLGILGLFVGIFFTLPLMFGTMLYAYEDLCNPPPKT
jgi:hypothetical protein